MGVVIPKQNPLQGSVIIHKRPSELVGIAIESDAIRLNRTSPLMQLSPQQPLDCGGPATALGCGGGFPLNIYAYVRRSGVVRLAEYPYQGARGSQCALQQNLLSPTASVLKFHVFQSHTEADIAVYIQNVGPLAAIVYADKWQHYTNGIMTAAACGYTSTVNHAVQIVGVDLTVANQSYWIIRNQWTASWGMRGFIRLEYGKNASKLNARISISYKKTVFEYTSDKYEIPF
eukprot:gene6120-biopygen6488